MALSKEEQQSLARQVGYTGDFGQGGFLSYLNSNPDQAKQYGDLTTAREQELAQPVPITTYQANQIQNPVLPSNTQFVPILQQVQANELQQAPTPLSATGQAITAPAPVTAQTIQQTNGQAAQVNPNVPLQGYNPNAGQAQATTTTAVPDMQAAQGTINANDTVQGQLAQLTNFKPGEIPAWARGAMNTANEAMAARGMGASSIGTTALFQAVQQAALPIAAQDAQTYFQMDLKNIDNQQQANLQNTQMRQQNMLTDVAVQNANAQFNAANAQQSQQFVSTMISQIMDQNAARKQAMSEFNAGQANQISAQNVTNQINTAEFNAQQKSAVSQFNATLANQREQFNSQMQFAIDQSNVNWRRSVNTANTSAVNAANQANVQNMYNMSQVALNNVWQQWRDEASWAFTASENQANRDYNMALTANNRQYASNMQDQAQQQSLYAGVGSLVSSLLFK